MFTLTSNAADLDLRDDERRNGGGDSSDDDYEKRKNQRYRRGGVVYWVIVCLGTSLTVSGGRKVPHNQPLNSIIRFFDFLVLL